MAHSDPDTLLATARQAREADAYTIEQFGVPGRVLMEIAGSRSAGEIHERVKHPARLLFVCGTGNNAGDAMVAARHLYSLGHTVTLILVKGTEKLSPDAGTNYRLLEKLQESDETGESLVIHKQWPGTLPLETFDGIIDGMLGTGLDKPVKPPFDGIIDRLNEAPAPVFALDLPTGLHADSGRIMGHCIRADTTITYGLRKLGLYMDQGPDHCGQVILCPLGFPPPSLAGIDRHLLTEKTSPPFKPGHKPRHKYEAGVVYVAGGSPGLTGAPVLSARSAWAAGAGAVTACVPHGLLPIFENHLIQQTKLPLGDNEDRSFSSAHADALLKQLHERPGVLLLGPGLGRAPETVDFVFALLERFDGDAVIDADALYALSYDPEALKRSRARIIITPHPGELALLAGQRFEDAYERLEYCERSESRYGITVLSKGSPCFLGSPETHTLITGYDTTPFARAGFGDVLCGKIAAYLSMGAEPDTACGHALRDGKHKMDRHRHYHSGHPLEPLHLL